MSADLSYNENELLQQIAVGDEAAFGVFFRSFSPKLRAQAVTFVKDQYGITEVMQESFIKIWLNRDKLPQVEHLHAYLKKIVLNESFNYLHKLARQGKLDHAVMGETTTPGNAEDNLSFKETQLIIRQAIQSLPPQRRTIYQLSRNEGLNSIEIGNQLGVSPDYVRRAISAARLSIKEQLMQAGKMLLAVSGFF